jgi:hypothetical protein
MFLFKLYFFLKTLFIYLHLKFKIMRILFFFSLFFLYFQTFNVNSQEIDFVWANGFVSFPEGSTNVISSSKTDNQGNIYFTGEFSTTLDFDPSPNIENLYSNGLHDVFIAKYDENGNYLWAKSIGGSGSDIATCLEIDNLGNIYITGYFKDTVDFDPSVIANNLISNGEGDIFIAKFNSNGDYIWANSIGGSGHDIAILLKLDSFGNILITGSYENSCDFNPSSGVNTRTSNGLKDAFIAKYNADGNFIWVKSIGGTTIDSGKSFSTDLQGNIYLVGNFSGNVHFEETGGFGNVISNGNTDIFITKLAINGTTLWTKTLGGSNIESANCIIVDPAGFFYIGGEFRETVDFDLSSGIFNLTSSGGHDAFLAKYDLDGNYLWAFSIGSAGSEAITRLEFDSFRNLYALGRFNDVVDFDMSNENNSITSNGQSDIFIAKYDSNGNFIWVNKIGNQYNESPSSIHIDSNDNLYVSGLFSGTLDLDLSSESSLFTSNSTLLSSFLVKYKLININKLNENLKYIISVSPNPSNGKINLDLGTIRSKIKIIITNSTGQLVYNKTHSDCEKIELEIAEKAGIYNMEIINDNEERVSYKFILN